MNNVSDNKNRSNALADRIAGFDDPSMGDERERDVILRAYTFGSIFSTYAFFTLALIFAVLGAGLWSALIVLASGVSGVAISAYCRRENVDFSLAMARVSPKRLIAANVIGGVFTLAWLAAVVFHMSNGYPLIDVGMGNRAMPGAPSSTYSIVIGAAIGFIIALTIMTVSRVRKSKQARAEAAAAAEIEDED